MIKESNYLTQYCTVMLEWQSLGKSIDDFSETEITEFQELKQNALKESGLTETELSIIVYCRRNNFSKKICRIAHRIEIALREYRAVL